MSDYKHQILILMQVLHLLWVCMGRFTKQINLYQRIYFLCSILEMEHKPTLIKDFPVHFSNKSGTRFISRGRLSMVGNGYLF